jgi:amidase
MDKSVSAMLESGTCADIGAAYRGGTVSVANAIGWYLDRIARLNAAGPALNAVKSVSPTALAEALLLDNELANGRDRGLLHGIPVLIKANVLMGPDYTVHAGVAAFKQFRPAITATLITRLRVAGAVILGQTNMTEFADYVSDIMPAEFSGAEGVVRNPHGISYGRGQGSSVGSAAAVAAAFAPLAVGGETQNSIQTPASYSSVVGFKPSIGALTRAGIMPLVPTQDAPGFLGRTVADVAMAVAAVAGADTRDPLSMDVPIVHHTRPREPCRSLTQVRIGVPRRAMADREQFAELMQQFNAALSALANAGATIVDPCDLPSAEQLQDVRSCVFATEFKAALNDFLADHAPAKGINSLADLIAWNEAHPEHIPYGQSLMIAAEATQGISSPQYLADKRRDNILSRTAGIDAAFAIGNVDVLIAPMGAAAKCTGKAGAPTLAIPVGKSSDGTPFGMTLYARVGDDADLLAAGALIEAAIGQRVLADF